MKRKIFLLLIAVAAFSLISMLSSNVQSIATNYQSDVHVVRMSDNFPSNQINAVNSQILANYPGLQEAIGFADKQYDEYESACAKLNCVNATFNVPVHLPTPHFSLDSNAASRMAKDPSFKFKSITLPDPTTQLYTAYIKYENGIYNVVIIK